MNVNVGSYHVFINEDYAKLQALIDSKNYSSIFCLVDENTARDCLPRLKQKLNVDFTLIKIKSGETHKTLQTATLIWDSLLLNGADRKSLVINLGGGVIGDMGGFCSATFMRGIDFIQIPTTLLSQVDASVGGKLGIDFKQNKNLIGLFQNPLLVWIDDRFLQTLPQNELRSGFAEILKHAIIYDNVYWDSLRDISLSEQIWESIILKSIEIKQEVVSLDWKEGGLRKILNFGHTIGHAVESVLLGTDHHLLHGEAIAIGMICEANIAFQKELILEGILINIVEVITKYFGKTDLPANIIIQITPYILADKKNKNKNILMSLPTKIGTCQYDIPVSLEEIETSIVYYNQL